MQEENRSKKEKICRQSTPICRSDVRATMMPFQFNVDDMQYIQILIYHFISIFIQWMHDSEWLMNVQSTMYTEYNSCGGSPLLNARFSEILSILLFTISTNSQCMTTQNIKFGVEYVDLSDVGAVRALLSQSLIFHTCNVVVATIVFEYYETE